MATRPIYTSYIRDIPALLHRQLNRAGTSHRRDRPAAKEAGAQPGTDPSMKSQVCQVPAIKESARILSNLG
jgi:hypothetical protein